MNAKIKTTVKVTPLFLKLILPPLKKTTHLFQKNSTVYRTPWLMRFFINNDQLIKKQTTTLNKQLKI